MDKSNYKTLGQMLQNIVEDSNERFSLHEFLLESTEEDRKKVESQLVDADYKQFYEFMDSISFVNRTEVQMAVCEYLEFVNDRPLCMWEMWDIYDIVDDYIEKRNLKLDDDED